MTNAVLVHGGFHGGWCWRLVAEPLRRLGWTVHTPSLTGSADRNHLLSAQLTQEDRIHDVIGLIEAEELSDVVLCGHSAGGMITTAVADRLPDRIVHHVLLDAVMPESGQSLVDVVGNTEGLLDAWHQQATETGNGWRLSSDTFTAEVFGVEDPARQAWVTRRLTDDSLRIWQEPLTLQTQPGSMPHPKTYVRAEQFALSFNDRLYERFSADPEWTTHSWDIGHNMMIIDPARVVDLLATTG